MCSGDNAATWSAPNARATWGTLKTKSTIRTTEMNTEFIFNEIKSAEENFIYFIAEKAVPLLQMYYSQMHSDI